MTVLSNVEMVTNYVGRSNTNDFGISDKWVIELLYNGKSIEVRFNMGVGHNGAEPDLSNVLDAMFSDATVIDMDFEEFCDEFGYSGTDNDKIVYENCLDSYYKLNDLFGTDFDIVKDEVFHNLY